MATTYEPIATNTLGSNTAVVTFSSIPATYTDLVLVSNIQSTAANNGTLRINGDTATNYSWTFLSGNGTAASSARGSSKNSIQMDNLSGPPTSGSTYQIYITNVMNYANATTYKTVVSRSGLASQATEAVVGLWRNTAAITSLSIQIDVSGSVLAGSVFTLYGIKAA
jgi:hypothetical protein